MLYFSLAFRNIFRNFRRTFFTFLAIAFGLAVLIVMDSMLQGIDQDSFKKIINYETGHIKIFYKGYEKEKDDFPLDKSIPNPEQIMREIRKLDEVKGVTSRVNFRIMLSDGVDQLPAIGVAISPQDDEKVFLLKDAVDKGSFFEGDEEGILLGEGLAEDFEVEVGDYLTILTRTRYETYQAMDYRIKGLLKTEDPQIDWLAAVIPLNIAQDALDMEGAVTEIDIRLKDPSKVEEFRQKLSEQIKGVEVLTWKDLAQDVLAISKSKYSFSIMIFCAIVLIALIGISNTILMAAFERTREIGVLAAMGMKRRKIVMMFVMEGAMIGFLGSVVGCLLGSFLAFLTIKYGIDYSFMMRDIGNIGYRSTGIFYGMWRPGMVLTAFIFGVVVSALVSIYPAFIASRMEPTDALKKV